MPAMDRLHGTLDALVLKSLTLSPRHGRLSRHAMCSTNRVLPQPVGPLSMTGNPRAWQVAKRLTSEADGK